MRPVTIYPPQSGQKHDIDCLARIYQASKLRIYRTVFVTSPHTDTFVDL